MDLGGSIRQARIARGLTVSGLAASSGLSKGFISQVESGRSNPSIDSLNRIARSLGVPIGDIVSSSTASRNSPAVADAAPRPRIYRVGVLAEDSSRIQPLFGAESISRATAVLQPGASLVPPDFAGRAGSAWCVVLEGEILFSQSPVQTLLEKGDAVSWDPVRRYRFENKSAEAARLYFDVPGHSNLPIVREGSSNRPEPADRQAGYAEQGPLRLAAMRANRHTVGRR